MLFRPLDLMRSLVKAAGSPARAERVLVRTAEELGGVSDLASPVLVALALCESGKTPEEVSKELDWREFEEFCSDAFRRWGFQVKENVRLTKPRAQIDLVAFGGSSILSVDCKHWRRGHSSSALSRFAQGQLRRSDLLRKKIDDSRPIASVILSLSEPEGRFVEGVPIVPVRTLPAFLSSLESYDGMIDYR
jgi:hypothetical protein